MIKKYESYKLYVALDLFKENNKDDNKELLSINNQYELLYALIKGLHYTTIIDYSEKDVEFEHVFPDRGWKELNFLKSCLLDKNNKFGIRLSDLELVYNYEDKSDYVDLTDIYDTFSLLKILGGINDHKTKNSLIEINKNLQNYIICVCRYSFCSKEDINLLEDVYDYA